MTTMVIEARLTLNDKALRRALGDPDFVKGPLREFLFKAGFSVEAAAKERAPVDTGRLRFSIATEVRETRALVGSNVFYAPFVEFGTRPHMPPVAAMQPWARRHGISAWALARAIAARGTKPHPFLLPGLLAAQATIISLLETFARAIENRWGRQASG